MINTHCKWIQVTLQEENFPVTNLDEDSRHVATIQDTLHFATFVAEASELNIRRAAKIQVTSYLHKTSTTHVALATMQVIPPNVI